MIHTAAASPHESAPADLLAEVFAAAATGRGIRADAARWLVDGIAAAVRRSEPLDTALGLSAPGQRSLQRQLLTLRRNSHLLHALRLVSVDHELGDWPRCERLAPLIRSFMSDTWPRVRRLDQTPADWPGWRIELFHAARTDLKLPCTASGLFALSQKAPRCFQSDRPAMLLAQLLDMRSSDTSNPSSWSVHEPATDLRRDWRQRDL